MTRARLLSAPVLLAILLPGAAAAQPVTFDVRVSPSSGTESDTFVMTVHIEVDGVSGPERFWPPELPDFSVLDTQRQSSTSMSYDPQRGQRLQTSEVRRYFLRPNRAGKLRIGPARIRVAGTDYETKPIVVDVRGVGTPADPGVPGDRDPTAAGGIGVPGFVAPPGPARAETFLHAVVDKKEAYVGEQVIVSWLLFTRTEVLKFEPRPPRFDGLWVETIYEPERFFTYHDTRVGRTPYLVTIVSKRAVFPTAPGKIEVKPYAARVATLTSALGRTERLFSPTLVIDVKPLPDGAPAGFDPTYVGEFSVEAEADRTEIEAADSLTLTLKVRAEGAIRRTKPPRLAFPGFTFREPRDYDEEVESSSGTVTGERVYRYWTTPRQGGQQLIPPIEIPYFSPRTGRYEVARSQAIPIMVTGDPGATAEREAGPGRENVIDRDIRLIRAGGAVTSRTLPRLYRSSWFFGLAALPPLAFLLVVASDRVRQRLKKETPRSRIRRARGRARQRFRVAEIHIRGNRPAKFFGELARVLYDYIEERVGQPVQSMTRDEMRTFLKKKGFAAPTIKRIDESLESFDFARFAPSAAGPEEMRDALRRTKELLRAIEKSQVSGDEEVA